MCNWFDLKDQYIMVEVFDKFNLNFYLALISLFVIYVNLLHWSLAIVVWVMHIPMTFPEWSAIFYFLPSSKCSCLLLEVGAVVFNL